MGTSGHGPGPPAHSPTHAHRHQAAGQPSASRSSGGQAAVGLKPPAALQWRRPTTTRGALSCRPQRLENSEAPKQQSLRSATGGFSYFLLVHARRGAIIAGGRKRSGVCVLLAASGLDRARPYLSAAAARGGHVAAAVAPIPMAAVLAAPIPVAPVLAAALAAALGSAAARLHPAARGGRTARLGGRAGRGGAGRSRTARGSAATAHLAAAIPMASIPAAPFAVAPLAAALRLAPARLLTPTAAAQHGE